MRHTLKSFFTATRLMQMVVDLMVSAVAFYGAYFLRFEGQIPEKWFVQFLSFLPIVLALRFLWRFPGGLHHHLWRFVSVREVMNIGVVITAGSLALVIIAELVLRTHLPWTVLAIDWGINLVGYLGLRMGRRVYTEYKSRVLTPNQVRKKVLVVGAGQAGNIFAKEILQRNPEVYLVGFVDDDPLKLYSRVQGIEVIGNTEKIPQLIADRGIDEVIICIPSAKPAEIRRIINLCQDSKVKVKTLPGLMDLVSGSIELNKIREVSIEDLLGRDPVEFDRQAISGYLMGRVVMVTGAGGSIGSELCRQIATMGPSRLLLVGRGEFSVYTIEMEMREKFPSLDIVPLIADVRDMNRMNRIFSQYSPDVVFHAAAHKHVPLMEKNPSEAIINNVFGTQIVANLADRYNAETFVLVSTDKAVNPTNVMGASKRLAEIVVQELATRSKTRFMSVRFGNVLGSRGSVIPLFRRQIEAGGPITITHPDIIRYFMTIPEAAQLVLQAGALGKGGEVFVLDMGDPVKIVDLARDMIKLSGLEPDVDIKIKFTGLRPGEKLYEELLTADEGTSSTTHKKIFIAKPEVVDREKLTLGLTMLQASATEGDEMAIRRGLKTLVTTYNEQKPVDVPTPAAQPQEG